MIGGRMSEPKKLPWRVRAFRRVTRELPPPRNKVAWVPRIEVPGADGVTLLSDHYVPLVDGPRPTVLVRSPYGRGFPWAHLYGAALAEQGYHVVLQSCRGTGGSTGTREFFRHEAADALATVAWLREQDWFDGRLGTIGPSYMGFTQLALAVSAPPELRAAVVQVGVHNPYDLAYPGGAFAFANVLSATAGQFSGESLLRSVRMVTRLQLRLRRVVRVLPLPTAFRQAFGVRVDFIDEWLAHEDADDPYWTETDLGPLLGKVAVPTALAGGWYDAALDQTLRQYRALRDAGCPVSLLVGSWSHTTAFGKGGLGVVSRGALAWLDEHLAGAPVGDRGAAVRVHVGGTGAWCDLPDWPPAGTEQRWYPDAGGGLGAARSSPGESTLRYDPADPTPSAGGQLLSPEAGPRDNGALESRADVLVFTSSPLTAPLFVAGEVRASLRVRVSTGYGDVFARLCDVRPDGRSLNITDGIVRLRHGTSGPVDVTVDMSSTAYQFAAGHRLRLQISGGAHPRFARNTGTGEPLATATRLTAADISVTHGASALVLPVVGLPGLRGFDHRGSITASGPGNTSRVRPSSNRTRYGGAPCVPRTSTISPFLSECPTMLPWIRIRSPVVACMTGPSSALGRPFPDSHALCGLTTGAGPGHRAARSGTRIS
jgi:putative CocE/NonD family hydrolase